MKYTKIRDNYLSGRKMETLSKSQLYDLSRLLDMDSKKLPRSYHTKQHLIAWINNALTLEIIEKVAKETGNSNLYPYLMKGKTDVS